MTPRLRKLTPYRQRLAEENLPLAAWVVNKYFPSVTRPDDQTEYHLEARLALCEAAQRYDRKFRVRGRPVKFGTYATKWIWGRMMTFHTRKMATWARTQTGFRWEGHGEEGQDQGAYLALDTSDEDTREVEEGAEDAAAEVVRLLSRVYPDDRKVLKMLYGVGGGGKKSYVQVAGKVGVSRERIRQRVSRAFGRIREGLADVAGG